MTVPSITLNDGTTIPQYGLGVWQVEPTEAERVVSEALEVGYRHIDTAQMYQNEDGVGAALKSAGLPREDVYVTTKLNNSNHDRARESLERSLELLGLEKVDLFLIHWPLPTVRDYVKTWETMISLREAGLATSVGVSNFQPEHLDKIVAATDVVPAVNQIELHPYFTNTAAADATRRQGSAVEVWSPLGQNGGELSDRTVTGLAEKYGKTPAQILLRWALDSGNIVFPKSVRRARLEENFAVFDFELAPDDVAALSGLDKGESGRVGPNPDQMAWIPDF